MLGSKGGEGAFARAMAGAGPAGVYVVVERVDEHCAAPGSSAWRS
ncbi:Extradiol dioxygenase OS=Streptomyces microflavus OX=1919 GN=G3I39_41915 PE=4 SV=1 [Streptomyces microflavus]